MANQNNKLISVPLNGPLNFNKLKTPVQNFNGYNDINSPLYGDTISPIYKSKEEMRGRPYPTISNGVVSMNYPDTGKSESLGFNYLLKEETIKFTDFNSKDIIAAFDEENYVVFTKNDLIIISNGKTLKSIKPYGNVYAKYLQKGDLLIAFKSNEYEGSGISIYGIQKETGKIFNKYISNPYSATDAIFYTYTISYQSILLSYVLEPSYDEAEMVFDKPVENTHPVFGELGSYKYKFATLELDFTKADDIFTDVKIDIDSEASTLLSEADLFIDQYIVAEGEFCIGLGQGRTMIRMQPAGKESLKIRQGVGGTHSNLLLRAFRYGEYDKASKTITILNAGLPVALLELNTLKKEDEEAMPEQKDITIKWKYAKFSKFIAGEWIELTHENKCISYQNGQATTAIVYKEPMNTRALNGGTTLDFVHQFRVYNQGILANYSLATSLTNVGTNISVDGSVDPDSFSYFSVVRAQTGKDDTYRCVYKNEIGEWIRVLIIDTDDITEEDLVNYYYYIDGYIIFKAIGLNAIAFDGEKYNFGVDWNNRFEVLKSSYYSKEFGYYASGININPALSEDKILSANTCPNGFRFNLGLELNKFTTAGYQSFSREIGDGIQSDFISVYYCKAPEKSPRYIYSYNSSNVVSIPAFEGTLFPTEATIIPSPLTEIYNTDFNQGFMKEGNDFYTFINYNSKYYFVASYNSLVDDIENMFIVQGQTFTMSKDYIFPATYNPPAYSIGQAMSRISGLKYCGALPTMAIFYSSLDKTLRQFTADSNLSILAQATEIDDIYRVKYNPQTSSIYLCTNNGIYIYSLNGQFRLPIFNVKDIYFRDDIIYIETDIDHRAYTLRPREGFEKIPVKITTRYYGQANNMVSNIDCIYIRLYNEDNDPDETFKIRVKTLNQGTFTTEEKEIKLLPGDWDENTHTTVIKYQPRYQKCVSMEAQIESDSAIAEMIFSNSQAESYIQAKPNLNI